jgi:hypothetical protein
MPLAAPERASIGSNVGMSASEEVRRQLQERNVEEDGQTVKLTVEQVVFAYVDAKRGLAIQPCRCLLPKPSDVLTLDWSHDMHVKADR